MTMHNKIRLNTDKKKSSVHRIYYDALRIFVWSRQTDSNPRPADYKSAALPTVLCRHKQRRRRAKPAGARCATQNILAHSFAAGQSFRAFCRAQKSSSVSCSGRAMGERPAASSACITWALGMPSPAETEFAAVLRRWPKAARTSLK